MSNYLIDRLLTPRNASTRPFLILPDDSIVSYAEFAARVNQVANCLVQHGLESGHRVAVQAPKSWQTLALYLGTIKAGGVFLPLNTAYTAGEIGYFVGDAEPAILVCDTEDAEQYSALVDNLSTAKPELLTLNAEGNGSLSSSADACNGDFQSVSRTADDMAAILYTSGTTGRSKGAMLTHDNLWSNAEVLTSSWNFSEDDVLLHGLPVFHTHGLFVASNIILMAGASMVFLPGFQIDAMIRNLPRCSSMMGVPTFYTRLLADERFDKDLVNHIRLFVSGSAPLLAETHLAFEQRTGHRILERYGMTETGMNCSNPYDGDRRAGTVGPALPGTEIRIMDQETGTPLPWGEIGSVQVRGPNVFPGYWRMPEKTAEEFTDDGFFITGDLGMLSDDDYLTIVGRSKDLIISGGYNIYPKEIELVLDTLPGVRESAVIGVAHPDFGEGVVAILTGDAPPDEAMVRQLVSDQLARFKQPKRVFHLDSLPRNTMGKVQKNLLRERFANSFD